MGIAPASLLRYRLKESGKAIGYSAVAIEGDKEASKYYPPTIKNLSHINLKRAGHNSFLV